MAVLPYQGDSPCADFLHTSGPVDLVDYFEQLTIAWYHNAISKIRLPLAFGLCYLRSHGPPSMVNFLLGCGYATCWSFLWFCS
jgi:hypothetical protein